MKSPEHKPCRIERVKKDTYTFFVNGYLDRPGSEKRGTYRRYWCSEVELESSGVAAGPHQVVPDGSHRCLNRSRNGLWTLSTESRRANLLEYQKQSVKQKKKKKIKNSNKKVK